jgi:hypothetical protein
VHRAPGHVGFMRWLARDIRLQLSVSQSGKIRQSLLEFIFVKKLFAI